MVASQSSFLCESNATESDSDATAATIAPVTPQTGTTQSEEHCDATDCMVVSQELTWYYPG